MRRLRALALRLIGLFGKGERERELAEELESHIALQIEDNERTGMNSEDARRAALAKLGSIEAGKEAYRDSRGIPMFENLWQDVRFAGRGFKKIRALPCWQSASSRSVLERIQRSSA